MNILVIGTGYVGTTTALVFAEMGWKVTGFDVDVNKIEQLRAGSLHFFEPGLEPLLLKHLQKGNITFTNDAELAIKANDTIIICVGTPANSDGSASLKYIKQVASTVGRYMNAYKLIIIKSTVPVGTQEKVTEWIRSSQKRQQPFDVASNPEFLREGSALEDSMYPDRVVVGTSNNEAASMIQKLYKSMNCPIILTEPRTAELIKYAANAFLATKISYINELARLCDKLNVNIKEVSQGIGLDPRIGNRFLDAGIGYGGSCFPKDVSALLEIADEHNVELSILEQVESVNKNQYKFLIDKVIERLGELKNKQIAVLGLSFKPNTDDTREAPSIRIIKKLLKKDVSVRVHDPAAELPFDLPPGNLQQYSSPEQALQAADAAIICTEWPEYKQLDWSQIKKIMKTPFLFDGRNMLDAKQMKAIGFYYQGIGLGK